MKKYQIMISLWSAAIFGVALVLLYAIPNGGLTRSGSQALLLWGDGVTIAGVILLLCAGAFFLDRKGVWDFAAYWLYQARYLLAGKRSSKERLTSYKDFKKLRQRGTKPLWPWISVGTVFFALGLILAIAYVA